MSGTPIVSYDTNPTRDQYEAFQQAYEYLNDHLFASALPPCLITLQRKNGTHGYFSSERFAHRHEEQTTDEIAMNPATFDRSDREILSTLAHEMCHLWQHHFGEPSRTTYHNREWAEKMMAIGLTPTSTGLPGGKMTGQRMTHIIEPSGPFDQIATQLIAGGLVLRWRSCEDPPEDKTSAKKNKIKYRCSVCEQNAWAKPGARLVCGDCLQAMEEAE